MKPVRRAVEALGADYAQWRVLSRVMLKTDLRSSSAMRAVGSPERAGTSLPWGMLIMCLVYGIFLAVVPTVVPGAYLSASIVLLLVALLVAMTILIDFQSVVISPNDYEILAHQPVSSRTYFLVKLTSILLYTGIIGALMGGFATVAFLATYGPAVALGWMLALAGTVVWTSLAMVFVYALILRIFSPERLRRVLSYLQFVMTMAIFVPLILSVNLTQTLTAMAEPPTAMLALPSTWFANILPLAAGRWSAPGAVAAFAALASTALLFHLVGHRLSLSYAARLGVILASSKPGRTRVPGRGFMTRWFPGELRVVSTLVRGQFRNDMNFRLGVLSILPITILYIFMSLNDGRLSDPFVQVGFSASGLGMIHFAVLGMPLVLMEHLFRSESYRAAWVFFATPVDRARLIGHVGHSVMIFFLLPYLAMLGGVFVWAFGDLWHAVLHTGVLGLISHLGIQARLLVAPRVPFSQPVKKGARVGAFMGVVLIGGLVVGLLPLILWAYARPSWTAAAIVVLLGAALAAPRIVTRLIRDRVGKLEFTG
ncbi:MAG: hypothetical protein F4139_15680 [Gemmatimonadetes bacterium]|nr:hypothetical protein [Gemmatimonadota bacterium]MYH54354.1 hypothetical protein [Gemmatimonadota bacterium]MYK67097.1 hypothetical protein [Gemmatimonadota bacterium]